MLVPPSTLFVMPAVVPEVLNLPVRAPNFTAAESFAQFGVLSAQDRPDDPSQSFLYSTSPVPQLSSLAFITTIGGDIVSIASPAPNASYTLQFFGPLMRCDTANSTSIDILNSRMTNAGLGNQLLYVAFLGNQEQLLVGWTPTGDETQIQGVLCGLYNTSYTVHFDFTNAMQTVNLLDRTIVNSTAISSSPSVYTSYFNSGVTTVEVNTTQFDSSTSLSFQTFSYLGMLSAFTNVIVGNVSAGGFPPTTTSVLDTKLGFGPDLHSILSPRSILFPNLTVQAGLEEMWFNFTMSLFGVNANVTSINEYVYL